jgi:hypothetical protein
MEKLEDKIDLILKNQLFIIEQLKYFRESLNENYSTNWEDERINFLKNLFDIYGCEHLHQKWVGESNNNPKRVCVNCNEILNKKDVATGDKVIPKSQVWWNP